MNPDNPDDTSFDPHPTGYPVVELEYPNYGASERCYTIFFPPNRDIILIAPCRFILLAPKDKDHYNPILDLENTLYTIVECWYTLQYKLHADAPLF